MKVENYSDLREFARRAPGAAAAAAAAVQGAAVSEIAKRVSAYVVALSPIGGVLSRDRHPGRLKRAWKHSSGAPGRAVIGNDAEHAAIIDRGRKRGVTPKGAKSRSRAGKGKKLRPNKAAKMLGSKQAPSGMTRPAWKRIRAEREAIIAKASKAAER